MHRTSGILLHPTSLPGAFGIGDLGPTAHRFVDFLAAAGQGLWQMLPLGPTGYRDSPYQCTSAFAGNPLLISPELLRAAGWVEDADLEQAPFPTDQVDFSSVHAFKRELLSRAFDGFGARARPDELADYAAFCSLHRDWLDDYALYAAIKGTQQGRSWTDWPKPLALREPKALTQWMAANQRAIDLERFCQFLFLRQWQALRTHANTQGVHLIGDIPIFVAHDSAEVWTHRDWFQLDENGHPTVIAGVPPDYFSATGQRWGNPLYRWDVLAEDGYRFWVQRLRQALQLVDIVRIDHFRGFCGYWEVPASEETAINGRWIPGPGMDLFHALGAALGGDLPLIAEDLGLITDDVIALRDRLELPGMAILQFGFESDSEDFADSSFLPHNHRARLAVYTGTHDNDTLLGWWEDLSPALRKQTLHYLRSDGREIQWDFIATALASVADLALFPMQDLLGLGKTARMNRPGSPDGNWLWRCTESQLGNADAERLAALSALYGRRTNPL
jgi:4-alpha-glucanotransferase